MRPGFPEQRFLRLCPNLGEAGRSGPPYKRGNWCDPERHSPLCKRVLSKTWTVSGGPGAGILAVAVLSDPSARTDRRAGLAPVDGRRLMALYYERIQSSGSDRMEEPARKCQPIGDFVWRSFQARSVCRTLKRGPHAWGQLYSHGIDDSSQFWQVPYWRAVGSPPHSGTGRAA